MNDTVTFTITPLINRYYHIQTTHRGFEEFKYDVMSEHLGRTLESIADRINNEFGKGCLFEMG